MYVFILATNMVPGYQNYGQCQVGLGIGIQKAVCII